MKILVCFPLCQRVFVFRRPHCESPVSRVLEVRVANSPNESDTASFELTVHSDISNSIIPLRDNGGRSLGVTVLVVVPQVRLDLVSNVDALFGIIDQMIPYMSPIIQNRQEPTTLMSCTRTLLH